MRRLALAIPLAMVASVARADLSALRQADRAALEVRADAMTSAVLSGDPESMYDLLPPPIVARLAKMALRTPEEFRALFIANPPKDTRVSEVTYDLTAADLFRGDDGSTYVLIPTASVAFDPYRGRFSVTATTVAIASGDGWHFMTISDETVLDLLEATYPALADAPLAPPTLSPAP